MIVLKGIDVEEIKDYFKMTGERAMIDAKIHKTYIVYKNEKGQTIKEHYNGKIEMIDPCDDI